MGIKAKFDMDAVRAYANAKKDEFIKNSLEAYKLACISMVARAKQTNTYQDQTHYLRSSIGCVLYNNGVQVYSYFESTGGEKGEAGTEKGLAYAQSIAESYGNRPVVAVVVAGAHYAAYVEAKGFDVLTGSTLRFADELKESFEKIKGALLEHIEEHFGFNGK